MKYKAIIETKDYKRFKFFEDGIGKYLVCKDAGTKGDGFIPLYFTKCKEDTIEMDVSGIIAIAMEAFETYEKHQWHPIKEGPPPEGKDILVTDIDGDVYATIYSTVNGVGRCYDNDGNKIKNITAWMYFPKGYKESEEE